MVLYLFLYSFQKKKHLEYFVTIHWNDFVEIFEMEIPDSAEYYLEFILEMSGRITLLQGQRKPMNFENVRKLYSLPSSL